MSTMTRPLCTLCVVGVSLALGACVSYQPIRVSSVDTLGLPASVVRVTDKRVSTIKRLRSILENRGFKLALSPPAGLSRVFVYKVARSNHGSYRIGSWLAARLDREPGPATQVFLLGKPTLNGQETCSKADSELLVAQYWCRDTKVRRSFAGTAALDGSYEAKLVREVLDELVKQTLAAKASQPKKQPATSRPTVAVVGVPKSSPKPRAKPIVAVFALEDRTRRLGPKLRSDLHGYLVTRLTESGRYRIVPSERLQAQLKAAKQRSYRRCYDTACQVEIGKALAAQKTLAARIVRLGARCTLAANLYDLKTETAEKAASTSVACRGEALRQGIDALVAKLAGGACESDKTIVVDHKKHCTLKPKPIPPFGVSFRLCGGNYTLRAVSGAARFWRGAPSLGGYGYNVTLQVIDSGLTVDLHHPGGSGAQGTWPTDKAALRAMAKQRVPFEVPAEGSVVQVYSVDKPCWDNSGKMTLRIEPR